MSDKQETKPLPGEDTRRSVDILIGVINNLNNMNTYRQDYGTATGKQYDDALTGAFTKLNEKIKEL